jgi:Tfp pilus assembly protein PilZ
MTTANRRGGIRVRVRASELFAEVSKGQVKLRWDVDNLSLGGAYVRADAVLPPGTTMPLTLCAPWLARPVKVEAEVVFSFDGISARARLVSQGMGLRFLGGSAETERALEELVKSLKEEVGGGHTGVTRTDVVAARRRQQRRVQIHKLTADALTIRGAALAENLKVKDISLGGLFLETERAFALGADLIVELTRSGVALRLRIRGQVISVVTPRDARMRGTVAGMSIRFEELPQPLSDELRRMLANFAPGFGQQTVPGSVPI